MPNVPVPATATGLPDETRLEIHYHLTLALDQLEADQLDPLGLRNLISYKRHALKLSHQAQEVAR